MKDREEATGVGKADGAWFARSTLFTFFIGVNDVELVFGKSSSDASQLLDKIFASYDLAIETLYSVGARNFLFLSAPAMDLAPGAQSGLKAIVDEFNTKLKSMIQGFQDAHPATATPPGPHDTQPIDSDTGASTFFLDTAALWRELIATPAASEDTKSITDTKGKCDYYGFSPYKGIGGDEAIAKSTEREGFKVDGCESFGSYFWKDGLHVMSPVHKAVARQVWVGLGGKEGGEGEEGEEDGETEMLVKRRRRRRLRSMWNE